jgi:alpha-methylacyl-CoA racemase
VVKVEPPDGDPVRRTVPAWYDVLTSGKRVVHLDLRDAKARVELDVLLAGADVCVEGFRPSTARAIGVDAATLGARHPHIVHCSISGYGQEGDDAERAGHDINYQGDVGLLGVWSGGASRPPMPQLLIADITGAFHAAIRILAALVAKGRTASGSSIDVSLAAAAAAWTSFVPPPILRGDYACYNVYQAADGEWLALGALESKFWERFCARLGKTEWAPLQFANDPTRSLLLDELRALIRTRDRDSWLREFAGVDCCLSPLADL